MKILIADDEHAKIRAVVRHLNEYCDVKNAEIDTATTADDVKSKLKSDHYDILLLDIIFPKDNISEPSADTSVNLLVEIDARSQYKKPTRIIGFTAINGLPDETIGEFSKRSWNIVQYSDSSEDWKQSISRAVQYTRDSAQANRAQKYDTDICIVTALRTPELDAVKKLPWAWSGEEPLDDSTWMTRGSFKLNHRVVSVCAMSAPRMGLVSSALLAAKAIYTLRPRFICMTGICAGVEGKVDIGDVLVANPSWNWQSGKHKVTDLGPQFNASPHDLPLPEHIASRIEQLNSDRAAMARIKSGFMAPPVKNELNIRCGPVASGSAVVADEDVLTKLLDVDRGMFGLEMEIYGLYAAAYSASRPRPTPIAFKSVCDFGSKDKNDAYQIYAAYTSAEAMRLFFERNFEEIESYAGSI